MLLCACMYDTHTHIHMVRVWYITDILDCELRCYTRLYCKMAPEVIPEHAIYKTFPGGACPQTPLVIHETYTFNVHVTPLLEILATGLLHLSLGEM